MDFKVELVTRRERRAASVAALATVLLVGAVGVYFNPLPQRSRAAQQIRSQVDIGGGRTVVVVTRVRPQGFYGPIVVDQDHWITALPNPAERPAPRASRRPRRT